MGEFKDGAGFRIVGNVVRKWLSPTGKFASLVLDVALSPRSVKFDMRSFNRGVIDDIRNLVIGQKVQATGQIDWEPVTTKQREKVKIDGYEKWTAVLSINAVTVEGSSRRADTPPSSSPASAPAAGGGFDDADPGFGSGSDPIDRKPGDPFDGDVPF